MVIQHQFHFEVWNNFDPVHLQPMGQPFNVQLVFHVNPVEQCLIRFQRQQFSEQNHLKRFWHQQNQILLARFQSEMIHCGFVGEIMEQH